MKKLLAVTILALAMPLAAWANGVAPPPCSSIGGTGDLGALTLADLMGLPSGCTIDDKIFSNFDYGVTASGTAIAVAPGDINVVIDDTPLNPGLQFQGSWYASSGQTNDSLIQFTVTVLEGGAAIKDASLSIDGSGTLGPSSVTVAETLCLAGTCTDGIPENELFASLLVRDLPGTEFDDFSDHVTFQPVMTVDVRKDIMLVAQCPTEQECVGGFATLSHVSQNFSEVPEPATLTLFGTGLVAIGGMIRRRKNLKK